MNKIDSYNVSNNASNLPPGTIFSWAASSKEPAGKAIEEKKLKQIRLILNSSTDISVLRGNRMQALREVKIVRITGEARDQGPYLTQEDITVLLCSSVSTIRRDIERLRNQGIDIPTSRIINITDIQRQTRHSTESIERYNQDFSRVVMLINNG